MSDDELARRLILAGKGWHDEDGPTIVDGIDADEGAGFPVRYHWASGGAGADSIQGFVRNNYLPMEETIRIAGTALDEARRQLDEARVDAARLRALLREVGGIIDEFDAADDSTEELRIIHKLGAWAERAITATPAAPAPGAVLDRELALDILERIQRDPGTAEKCQGCRTAISLASEGLALLGLASTGDK